MNILAIGAHPDDIEFGCGGALLKYSGSGHNVFFLVLTKGDLGGDPVVRLREQKEAALFLGAKDVFWGNFNDTELLGTRETILKIEEVLNKVSSDVLFLNYYNDVHQDHRAAS